jgi:hypothetical protein
MGGRGRYPGWRRQSRGKEGAREEGEALTREATLSASARQRKEGRRGGLLRE